MQGRNITMLTAEYRVAAVKLVLKFWYQHVEWNKFCCFHMMNEYLEESGIPTLVNVKHDVTEHHRQLQNSFEVYFLPTINNKLAEKPFHWLILGGRFLNQGIQVVDVSCEWCSFKANVSHYFSFQFLDQLDQNCVLYTYPSMQLWHYGIILFNLQQK